MNVISGVLKVNNEDFRTASIDVILVSSFVYRDFIEC